MKVSLPPAKTRLWPRMWRRPRVKVALFLLMLFGSAAVFADFIASDLPVFGRIEGRWYLFANLTEPATLRNLKLESPPAASDWVLPPLSPFGPHRTDLAATLAPPSARHWLGTDELGRDVFARIVHGARVSLSVGIFSVALYVLLGVFIGAMAGYHGGRWDLVVGRIIEVMMTFPTFFFVLCVLGLMRVKSVVPIIIVIGLTRWTDVARLIRAEVLRLRTLEFVQASRALGASDWRTLTRHVLPNAMGPVVVAATFGIASAILLESGLSFLGFGVPPPTASWGELLTQAHRYVTHPGAWWLTLFPGVAIFLTVTAFNVVGEGLRDALDPHQPAEWTAAEGHKRGEAGEVG